MATYSLGTSIKVYTAINLSSAGASHTVNANGYAVVTVGGAGSPSGATINGIFYPGNSITPPLFLGPGATIVMSGSTGATCYGVEFINSP